MIFKFRSSVEYLVAIFTHQAELMISHMALETCQGFTNLATLVTSRWTWSTLAQVERLDVVITSSFVAVPSITVLALDRLCVHFQMDVKRSHTSKYDRLHSALSAGMWRPIEVTGQMFQ